LGFPNQPFNVQRADALTVNQALDAGSEPLGYRLMIFRGQRLEALFQIRGLHEPLQERSAKYRFFRKLSTHKKSVA
jgi:hypothetical protein